MGRHNVSQVITVSKAQQQGQTTKPRKKKRKGRTIKIRATKKNEEEEKKERWKPRGTQKNNQNQTRRRKYRQLRESVRDRGEIQPIRDEMELLESERRIFIPGCCTEKREKRERGKKKKGRE